MVEQIQLSKIPTDDPQEALRFCQALAGMLASPPASSVRVEPPSPGIEGLGASLPPSIGGRGASPSRLPPPTLSVVIPVYNEAENIAILYKRLTDVLDKIEPKYEIIFVDDGSVDGSVAILSEMAAQDSHITVVELARNFGHQVAISAGLDYARGDAVIIMDADLQDPPEVLPKFIAKLREGHDVVYAIRERRKEGWLKRTAYAAFYRLLQRVANIEIPLDAGDFCIMDRRVVDELARMPERNRFVRGIRSWVGLDQVGLAYERDARYAGKPKYTFAGLLYLALDGLISFSYIPLRAITILGFFVSGISILFAIGYTVQKLTVGLNPPGFATTVVAILFLAGVQLVTLGVIGEYIGRIFEEVKRRPLYIVRRVVGGENSEGKCSNI